MRGSTSNVCTHREIRDANRSTFRFVGAGNNVLFVVGRLIKVKGQRALKNELNKYSPCYHIKTHSDTNPHPFQAQKHTVNKSCLILSVIRTNDSPPNKNAAGDFPRRAEPVNTRSLNKSR